jgi:hypothetical protein
MARSKGGSVAFGLLYGSSRSGSEHLNYPDRNKGWPNRLVLVHKGTLGSRLASALSAQTADCLCCDLTMWASSLFSPAGAGLALTIFLSRTAAFCLLRICHSNSCFGMISDYAVFAGLRACPIGFTFFRFAGSLGRDSIFSASSRAPCCGRTECGLSSDGVRVVAPATFLIGVDLPRELRRPETFAIKASYAACGNFPWGVSLSTTMGRMRDSAALAMAGGTPARLAS